MTKAKLPPGVRIRPDGRYEQRLTLDGVRVSVYAKSAKELKAAVETRRQEHAQGLALRRNETVETYLKRWLRDVIEPHREYRTLVMHRNNVENHLSPTIGHIRLDRLSVADVRDFMNGYLGTYKPGTINIMRATLVAALNEAINEDLIARNVAARVPKIKGVEAHRPPLTRAEADRFLAAVRGDRLEALYRVALVCGLRINEALGLTWDRLDLDSGEARIDRQLQRQPGAFVLKPLKNRASVRTIMLPAMARRALLAHRDKQEHERATVPAWRNAWGLVFTGPGGQPLYDARVRELWARYCRDADLPHGSPHDARHTAASLLAAQGVPEVEVSQLLGHATSATTRAIYTHAYDAGKDRVAGAMDSLFADELG